MMSSLISWTTYERGTNVFNNCHDLNGFQKLLNLLDTKAFCKHWPFKILMTQKFDFSKSWWQKNLNFSESWWHKSLTSLNLDETKVWLQRSRGFGFITFRSASSVARVCNINEFNLNMSCHEMTIKKRCCLHLPTFWTERP